MATICNICQGSGKYYLLNQKEKDCENCNTTGLIEPADKAEDIGVRLENWYTIHKDCIEVSLNSLEEMINTLLE